MWHFLEEVEESKIRSEIFIFDVWIKVFGQMILQEGLTDGAKLCSIAAETLVHLPLIHSHSHRGRLFMWSQDKETTTEMLLNYRLTSDNKTTKTNQYRSLTYS